MKTMLVFVGLLLVACQPQVVTVPGETVVQTVVVEKEVTRQEVVTLAPAATATEPAEATEQPTTEPTREPVMVQLGNEATEFARGGVVDEWECSEGVSTEGTGTGKITLVSEKDYPTIEVVGTKHSATEAWFLVVLKDGSKCYLNQNEVTLLGNWTFEDIFGVFNP